MDFRLRGNEEREGSARFRRNDGDRTARRFPSFLEPREASEQALVAVVHFVRNALAHVPRQLPLCPLSSFARVPAASTAIVSPERRSQPHCRKMPGVRLRSISMEPPGVPDRRPRHRSHVGKSAPVSETRMLSRSVGCGPDRYPSHVPSEVNMPCKAPIPQWVQKTPGNCRSCWYHCARIMEVATGMNLLHIIVDRTHRVVPFEPRKPLRDGALISLTPTLLGPLHRRLDRRTARRDQVAKITFSLSCGCRRPHVRTSAWRARSAQPYAHSLRTTSWNGSSRVAMRMPPMAS